LFFEILIFQKKIHRNGAIVFLIIRFEEKDSSHYISTLHDGDAVFQVLAIVFSIISFSKKDSPVLAIVFVIIRFLKKDSSL